MGYFYNETFLFAEERFLSVKSRQLKLKNYILLDEYYIHAHSKTINSAYGQTAKYQLLYDSWLEFTKVCRTHGRIKANILKPLMKLSLLEMRIMYGLKSIFN
jgi:hypothetical protein